MPWASRAQRQGFFEKQERESIKHLTSLGIKNGKVFEAKFSGGKCGVSGMKIWKGDKVAYFRTFGLCNMVQVEKFLADEARAKLPKCGCGKIAWSGHDVCERCDYVAGLWFDNMFGDDVTRDLPNPVISREQAWDEALRRQANELELDEHVRKALEEEARFNLFQPSMEREMGEFDVG